MHVCHRQRIQLHSLNSCEHDPAPHTHTPPHRCTTTPQSTTLGQPSHSPHLLKGITTRLRYCSNSRSVVLRQGSQASHRE